MGREGRNVLAMRGSLVVLRLRLMLQLPQQVHLLLCQLGPLLRRRSLLRVVLPQGLHAGHVRVPCPVLLGVHWRGRAEASQLRAVQLRQAPQLSAALDQ